MPHSSVPTVLLLPTSAMNKFSVVIVLVSLLALYGVATASPKKSPFEIAAVSHMADEDCPLCALASALSPTVLGEHTSLLPD